MTIRDTILAAIDRLAEQYPPDKITMGLVAKEADVSQPTVRRYIGGKQQLKELLKSEEVTPEAAPLDTRSRILLAARKVFAREGYAGATLDAIAAQAGLTKGAVYWHFTNKNDLFLALMEEHINLNMRVIPEQVQSSIAVPGEAGIAQLLGEMLAHIQGMPDWVQLYFEFVTQSREQEVQEMLSTETYQKGLARSQELAEQLQAHGQINPDLDAFVVATFWTALVDGLMLHWKIDPERTNPTAMAPALAQILWNGLQPTDD
ncbi:hypothetical protein C7271_01230 [filamentous cyanobacterium CCP5]|nr:hypothetical protein C7271_01230 [filamentous cyanobacterium CCP5]